MYSGSFKFLYAYVLCLFLGACAGVPEPERFNITFDSVSANVGTDEVALEAELSADGSMVSQSGFLYGRSEDNMVEVSAQMADSRFSKSIADLEYEQEYVYMAYVGNGKNRLYSEKHTFISPARPDEVVVTYHLDLSSYETYFADGTHWNHFQITVLGNADFEVIIPEDVHWVTYNVVGRECGFTVNENLTNKERECLVAFRSLNHDCSVTHRIVQGGTSYECLEIDVSPLAQCICVPAPSGSSNDGGAGWHDSVESGWVGYVGSTIDGSAMFGFAENTTDEARRQNFVIYLDDQSCFCVNLIQHAYQEVIDFKDPVVKEICVGLWDLGGDGELSFEEAAAVPVMKKEDFAGFGITSFDEFRFFPDYIWSDYLFEGSSLVSVSLPYPNSQWASMRRGQFKDCANLQHVDLRYSIVVDDAFMNCTSLKEIDAFIEGWRAFMGCTSLEKVNQRTFYLPNQAFKNCTALREMTFDERFFSSDLWGTIGEEALYGCENLPEIHIYRRINLIEDRAFYGCTSLKDVYLESGIPPELGEDAFTGTSPDLKFHVPASAVNAYKKQWPELADRIIARD